MDRVIPKDVVDLIYKESYLDKLKRLNEEYHNSFCAKTCLNDDIIVKYRFKSFYFSYRSLTKDDFDLSDICSFRNNKIVNVCSLPKKYLFSSGQSELKWIE